jgi:hypothetical protein
MAEKIVYKNYCTPQEQADFTTATDRWYLDSDVGRSLSGVCESKASTTGSLVTGVFSTTISLSSKKFIYVKNTDTSGSNYLLLNIGSMGAVIKLGPEESFASDIGSNASDSTSVAITASGTPAYEYIAGT